MKKWTVGKVLYWVLVAIFSLIFIYPIYFMVISSFKNKVVEDSQGHVLLTYTPLEKTMEKLPEPAKAALDPEKILTNEELYLTGLHIEQYRHATYDPGPYDPGNLYYDKKQYDLAMELWEQSRQMDDTFPPVFRNLALGAYNKEKDPEKARELMEKAFSLNKKDSRTFLELDQLYKKIGISHKEWLEFYDSYPEVFRERDDLVIEYVTLKNLTGKHEEAYQLLMNRRFHPWEGGEGKATGQYVASLLELAKEEIGKGGYQKAKELLPAD